MTVSRRGSRNLTVRLGVSSLEAAREAEKQQLVLPRRPGGEPPQLPLELTELMDRELMALFGNLNRWAGFLGVQLSMAQVDERYADKLVEKLTAYGRIRSGQKTATAMKAAVWGDEDYEKAADELQAAYAYRKLVEALYNAVDRDAFLVSRELTRRIGRDAKDRRHERHGD